MGLGSKLKALRTVGGLSLRELAAKLKVDHAYLSRLENEAVPPSEKIIKQLAVLFKVPKGELELYAGKLPGDVAQIFYDHPKEALFFLREQFPVYNTRPTNGSNGRTNGRSVACKLVFETDLGKLYQGDCLNLLSTISSESIDCVFADPPFNLNKNYGERVDDNLAESKYLEWSYQWLGELCRVLKPGGSLFIYNLPKWNIYYAPFLGRQLDFRHWVAINIKTTLPIPGRLYPSHYSLLYFTKGRATTFVRPRVPIPKCRHCGGDIKDYGGHRKWLNPAGLNLTDVWDDIPPVRHQKYKSRTANELSTKLLERVLGMSTQEGDVVLDPFGGGGTTYYAAETMGRRWIGCEIESCQPIIRRLKSDLFTGHRAKPEELVAVG